MGLHDYERESIKNIPVYNPVTGHNNSDEFISNIEYIQKNKNYLKMFKPFLDKYNYATNIINRKAFKYTKLREEMIFVTCIINKPGTENFSKFIFVVNEKSIWHRFNFYNASDITKKYNTNNNIIGIDMLKKAIQTNEVYTTLNIMNFETSLMNKLKEKASSSDIEKVEAMLLKSGNPIEIISFENHSKLVWLEYFKGLTDSDSLEFGEYSDKDSDTFYDISSKENMIFSVMTY